MSTQSLPSFEVDADAGDSSTYAQASADRPKQGRLARFFAGTLARDAALIVIGVMVAELLLQVLAPEYGHDFYDREFTASHPVIFNPDGYRGPAVPKTKTPGELRILGIGDSTTFGTGVGIEDTWPLQLKDMLAATSDRPVSAMNVGLQGASLGDLSRAYEQRWADYQPDVVVALVSSNMISFAWMQRNVSPQMPAYVFPDHGPAAQGWHAEIAGLMTAATHIYGRLCLPHFVSINMQRALYWAGVLDHHIPDTVHPVGALLAHGWIQQDLPRAEVDEAWSAFARQLHQLREATSQHGAKLIVAFSPCRFDLSDSLFDDEKNLPRQRLTIHPEKRLADLCREEEIVCVDSMDALRTARTRLTQERGHTAPMYVLFDYNHLNHDGHNAIAAALLPDVRDLHPSLVAISPR